MDTEPVSRPAGVPWEERRELGLITAFWRTVSQSLLSPTDFFRRMSPEGGYGPPILFALIPGMIGVVISLFWQGVIGTLDFLDEEAASGFEYIGATMGFAFFYVLIVLVSPFLIIFGLFVWTLITHALLIIVGGAKKGFQATFRTLAYCSSTELLGIIPFCGGLISMVWKLVIQIVGLAEVHGTTRGRAAFAVLLPLFLCVGTVVMALMFGLFAALVGAS